jgi:hypothetical protein
VYTYPYTENSRMGYKIMAQPLASPF